MIKSPNDNKEYQPLTLDNGLRVLLVHNTSSNKSAAALAVNVGHFDDPSDRQGLAHFLEHMLFLGTEKFPDGSEYQQFIAKHGGSNNAWTATEHTCFFFDINYQLFSEAIERFGQFFSAPLLSESFVNKERKNIDAEFKLKLKDDIRRLYDVHKETINPKHPFAKFSVGNSQTLEDRDNRELRAEIQAFFDTHYQAHYMTLVLEGPQSLDELKSLAQQHFATIKTNGIKKPTITEPLYESTHLQKWINVLPVKNDKQLIVSFAMPSIDPLYRNKPESILAYLLGHEGPGSILSVLKNKQWAISLTAGSGVNGSNFKDFNISISLTELGENHINEIIDDIFSYLNKLTNTPLSEHYYQEKQALATLAFNYQEKQSPLDSVSQLVVNMQHYPEDDYIFGDYVMAEFHQSQIDELLQLLIPKNMRVIIVSQKNQTNPNSFLKTSRWYKVPYNITDIDPTLITRWQQRVENSELFLPKVNPYIVAEPPILSDSNTNSSPESPPENIHNSDGLSIWFKQDVSFNTPKGYIYISIDSPAVVATASSIAMTKLFIDLYSDAITEQHYDAELAGIHYHLYSHQGGMTLQLSGISTKQEQLLSQLLISLTAIEISQSKFALFKQQLINHWKNTENSKSISQLFAALSSTMQPKSPSSQVLIEALSQVQFDDFQWFIKQLFKKVAVDALIHGNWLPSTAQQIVKLLKSQFSGKLSDENRVKPYSLDIDSQGEITLPIELPDHDHAAVLYFPMEDKDLNTVALSMLTSQLLSPVFFQEMRTEKQYGYLVGVGFIPINRYPGIAFYIQSPNTNSIQLTQAMLAFIHDIKHYISQLSPENWQHIQYGLASQLQEKDASLRIKSQRFWASICNKEDSFTQKQKLIDIIQLLTIDDLTNFLTKYFHNTEHVDYLRLVSFENDEQFVEMSLDKDYQKKLTLITKKDQRKY